MKKISILFIFALLASVVAHAELSQRALNMRTQLKSYINSLGYNPSIDEDGDIAFEYDNLSYYVHFQDYKDAVAVSLVKSFRNDTGKSNAAIDRICYDVMSDFVMVKVYPTTTYKSIRVETESLYSTSAQVKEFFEDNLMIVSIVAEDLLDRI